MSSARALAHGGEAEGIGLVWPGEGKASGWGECKSSSPVLAERTLGSQIQALYSSAWQETMDTTWKKVF